jgi:sulfatase maturation enzyme AslB (radical SAM superfamily)
MARLPVNLVRKYTWGILSYDTLCHSFSYKETEPRSSEPYPNRPVVLNIVITRRCNMDCDYCVAKDFAGIENEDLILSAEMIRWINRSSFMLLVLTGGEPLMPPYDAVSMRLLDSVKGRGVILDTNGTFLPDPSALLSLKKNRVMVRVSMDSIRPEEEIERRRVPRGQDLDARSAYFMKLTNIEHFLSAGVNTAVQTVVWRKNAKPLYQMIDWLSDHGIKQWYLQRLIPSYRFKHPSVRFSLKTQEYYSLVQDIAAEARSAGIECIAKMDLRHNSVFLLTADGALYTQGAAPGQKVRLGTIKEEIEYFDYVSAADHAWRYYLAYSPQKVEDEKAQSKPFPVTKTERLGEKS